MQILKTTMENDHLVKFPIIDVRADDDNMNSAQGSLILFHVLWFKFIYSAARITKKLIYDRKMGTDVEVDLLL